MHKNLHTITEAELLVLYHQTGNKEYIGAVLVRYSTILLGVCKKYLKDDILAEDMVQQIVLKVLDRKRNEVYENFGGWLYTITRNACLSELNKIQYFAAIQEDQIEDEELDIKHLLEKDKKLDDLNAAMTSLNKDQKKCIELFYFQDKSYVEIAQLLGIEIKQVKSHIQNGKRNLKLKLNA